MSVKFFSRGHDLFPHVNNTFELRSSSGSSETAFVIARVHGFRQERCCFCLLSNLTEIDFTKPECFCGNTPRGTVIRSHHGVLVDRMRALRVLQLVLSNKMHAKDNQKNLIQNILIFTSLIF